ncbi:hypothetical protein QFC22_005603 [Naganishia vaughanmartiniae]|uniref:Uncharacterized protein n=1 Tax=Naganishia vaughanmartiniae TaxID=1424756 RepID=A0ACC2WSW9_9TREE|nr:hypothetical protein QFC22_005603 [Naganishia vaughanmartiniae]
MILVNIPIIALSLVLALGLDQAPRTQRWRLLLMTEGEEMTWARRKFDEVMQNEGESILPPSDPRVKRVARVASALITALEEEDKTLIYGATWPPSTHSRVNELTKVMHERERGGKYYPPSAIAKNSFVPFRHDAGDPLMDLDREDWNIYVVEGSKINAFALPSKEIFVYSGLVDLVDDDTLLSGILAHEIAHVTQRHAVENFMNVAAVGFDIMRGISFALTMSFPVITDSAAVFINWLHDVVAERAYSRKLEMEADAVGLNFMASAGYDPRAALDLWDLMAAVEADAAAQGRPVSIEDRLSFLQTHPTSQVRQEALAQLMPNAMKIYKESQARRKAVPIKTESITATIDTKPAVSTKAQENHIPAVAKKTAAPSSGNGKKDTALYTTSPAISREAITPEKTRRAEELSEELGKERERMYARWGEGQGSVRLV